MRALAADYRLIQVAIGILGAVNLRVLDGLRGLTALYVVLYHATGLLWSAPSPTSGPPWWLANAMSFGHQAVVLFFLISGFCIHYAQARSGVKRVDVGRFAWRRARRLYPPLVLALVLTAVFDGAGASMAPHLYGEASSFWEGPVTVGSAYDIRTLIGNLALQARLSVPEFGSNSPLWSLAFEFWFYVLYPLMHAGFARFGAPRMTICAAVISASSWFMLDWLPWWHLRVLSDWGVWVTGAFIADLYVRGARPRVLRIFGPIAPVVVLAFAWVSPIGAGHERIADLWWGAALSLGLAYVMLVAARQIVGVFEKVCLACGWLGTISYSLYLVHYPLLALFAAAWLAHRPALPDGLELAAVGVVGSVMLGWLAWLAVERHCVRPRRTAERSARAQAGALRAVWIRAT